MHIWNKQTATHAVRMRRLYCCSAVWLKVTTKGHDCVDTVSWGAAIPVHSTVPYNKMETSLQGRHTSNTAHLTNQLCRFISHVTMQNAVCLATQTANMLASPSSHAYSIDCQPTASTYDIQGNIAPSASKSAAAIRVRANQSSKWTCQNLKNIIYVSLSSAQSMHKQNYTAVLAWQQLHNSNQSTGRQMIRRH